MKKNKKITSKKNNHTNSKQTLKVKSGFSPISFKLKNQLSLTHHKNNKNTSKPKLTSLKSTPFPLYKQQINNNTKRSLPIGNKKKQNIHPNVMQHGGIGYLKKKNHDGIIQKQDELYCQEDLDLSFKINIRDIFRKKQKLSIVDQLFAQQQSQKKGLVL